MKLNINQYAYNQKLNTGEIIMYSLPKVDPNIDYSKVRVTLSDVNNYSVL